MKLLIVMLTTLVGCASRDVNEYDGDSYRIGCYDAVYNYILERDNVLTMDSLPDSLYASDYCRFMQERRGL